MFKIQVMVNGESKEQYLTNAIPSVGDELFLQGDYRNSGIVERRSFFSTNPTFIIIHIKLQHEI